MIPSSSPDSRHEAAKLGSDEAGALFGLDLNLAVSGGANGLSISTSRIAVDATPLRVRGRVGDGLYWALRASGVNPATASEL